ncbi:amidohydrolase family protein [Patescibacteria group bacterium]
MFLFNGNFWTGDAANPWAKEIFVQDGKIVAVDNNADAALRRAVDEQFTLPGAVATRGLYDGHNHHLFVLVEGAIDLGILGSMRTADNRELAVRELLRAELDRRPEGCVLMTNWSFDADKGLPASALRRAINEVAHGREVMALQVSWHNAVLSHRLEQRSRTAFSGVAGLNGRLEAGVVYEDWVLQTLGLLELDQDELRERILRRQHTLFGRGITSMFDKLILGRAQLDAMVGLSCSGQLIMPTQGAVQPIFAFGDRKVMPGWYGESLNVTHLKYLADGAFGAQNAWMGRRYSYCDGTHGELYWPHDALVKRHLIEWQELGGSGVATHCIGPGATAHVLNAYEQLMRLIDDEDFVFSLEHFEAVTSDMVWRAAKLQAAMNLTVCSQPAFCEDLAMTDRLPPEVLALINPYYTFHTEGLKWHGGTDGPITGDDYLGGMAMAVNRTDDQAVTADLVFSRCTEGPIAVGEPFNVICLDSDPFVTPDTMVTPQVLQTWLNGNKVFDRADEPVD